MQNGILRSPGLTFLLCLALLVLVWGWILFGPLERLSRIVSDDAFYYFITAHNFFHTGVATYDGFTETSGFHPLWMLVTAPLFGLLGKTELAFRLAAFIQLAIYCGAVTLIARTCAHRWGEPAAKAAIATLILYPFYVYTWLSGVEGALFSLAIALIIYLLVVKGYGMAVRDGTLSARRAVMLGIVAGLTALVRIEAGFLLAALFLWLLWPRAQGGVRRSLSLALSFGLAGGVVIAPYFVWLWTSFGYLQPVSGITKRLWAADQWQLFLSAGLVQKAEIMANNLTFHNPVFDPARIAGLFGGAAAGPAGSAAALWLVLLGTAAAAIVWRDRWLQPLLEAGLAPVLAYVAFRYLYYATALFNSHRDWYHVPEMLLSAMVIGVRNYSP